MNNNQFRRLVTDTPSGQNEAATSRKPSAPAPTLGAKKTSFMPMTPRNVKGGIDADFARQVRERNAALLPPKKKFKSAVPKGVKYGAGYTDRAKARAEEEGDDGDDKAGRIQALEEQMKLGQISEPTFLALRDEITGGDISSTHLVKGLDWKLLERVRKGEDVLDSSGSNTRSDDASQDVDEELDRLAEKEVQTVKKASVDKKGSMAPPRPIAGTKRSRDEIMAELKAQRKAAAETKAAPLLNDRWKKVGEREKSRTEIDHKGREVLITVDEDGVVKKRVRKLGVQEGGEDRAGLDMPDGSKPVLGADVVVPEVPQPEASGDDDDDDDDIFEGMGVAYDPLGVGEDGEDDDGDSANQSSSEEDDTAKKEARKGSTEPHIRSAESTSECDIETTGAQVSKTPRNYFKETTATKEESSQDRLAGVQELLKKAAKMDPSSVDHESDSDRATKQERDARLTKRAEMLAQEDRDMDDMDLGFGGSRYDDGEDETGSKVKLSEWRDQDGGEEHKERGGDRGHKKKRKPKKRKGDGNNMADIMRVIDGRKAGGGK